MAVNISIALVLAAAIGVPAAAEAKTLVECTAAYAANADKINGLQSQDAYLAACRTGQEIVPGSTSAATSAVPPAIAAQQAVTPAAAGKQPAAP